jgi:oligopeptide transport system substrate-binding protein
MCPKGRIGAKAGVGSPYQDEPATLDPAKAVGLPEIQVIRDLYEGLVNQNERGDIVAWRRVKVAEQR